MFGLNTQNFWYRLTPEILRYGLRFGQSSDASDDTWGGVEKAGSVGDPNWSSSVGKGQQLGALQYFVGPLSLAASHIEARLSIEVRL